MKKTNVIECDTCKHRAVCKWRDDYIYIDGKFKEVIKEKEDRQIPFSYSINCPNKVSTI